MKIKTSVSLSKTLLEEIDRNNDNRSAFLEEAAKLYLARKAKRLSDANDAAILEKNAEWFNREATDVLGYQTLPD